VNGNLDPRFFGGLSSTLTYRNWSFSFLFEYRKQMGLNYLGQLAFNLPGTLYNQPDLVLQRWTRPGATAPVQRFSSEPFGTAYTALSFFNLSNGIYSDASFIRLRNVELSYTLPATWLRRLHLSEARFYFQGQNLLTFTSFKGTDPETQNFFVVPPLRTLVAGIQINF
jgi:hypothetical protein